MSSNRRNLKTPALHSSVDGNNFEKTLFKNDERTIITRFPSASFPQTQIQNDRWLLRFQISPAKCGRASLIKCTVVYLYARSSWWSLSGFLGLCSWTRTFTRNVLHSLHRTTKDTVGTGDCLKPLFKTSTMLIVKVLAPCNLTPIRKEKFKIIFTRCPSYLRWIVYLPFFVLFQLSTWKLVVTGIHLCPTSGWVSPLLLEQDMWSSSPELMLQETRWEHIFI